MFNDLSVCGTCNCFLNEQKKKKIPHPYENFDEKHFEEEPKRKKKK